ncbi:MAG: beta-galactosidase trimerization domain-containing protein [Phycisphaeraceae bacterium]
MNPRSFNRWMGWLCAGVLVVSSATVRASEPMPVADWHCRTLDAPRVLVIDDHGQRSAREAWAHQMSAAIGAEVDYTLAHVTPRDHLLGHHLADKPLEETPEMKQAMAEMLNGHRDRLLERIEDYDVVIARLPRWNRQDEPLDAVREKLAAYVRGGGALVYVARPQPITMPEDSDNPEADAQTSGPLADLLPIRAHHRWRSWTSGSAGATDHPLSRGIPFEIAGFHTYSHMAVPIDDRAERLTRAVGERNLEFWYRRAPESGQVVQLFSIGGQRADWTHGKDYEHYAPLRPDESALWPQFMRRLVYGLTHGEQAFPVLARVDLPDEVESVRADETLAGEVDLENRLDAARRVTVQVTLTSRFTGERVEQTKQVELDAAQRRTASFELTAALPCIDEHLELRATVTDAQSGRVLSQASRWLRYDHAAPITVALDRSAVRSGEAIEATVAADDELGDAALTLRGYLVDHRGRALQVVQRQALGTLRFEMPAGGSEWLANYWVVAQLERDDRVVGTARAMVQRDDPWDTRNKLEFSMWSRGGNPQLVALMRDAGFNALGMRIFPAAADRHGLRAYRESTGINTFSVEIKHDNWDDTRAMMADHLQRQAEKHGIGDRSVSLVSLGEESGFKGGWGRRYYWDGEHAPEVPQRVFAQYLRDRYDGDIDALNEQWDTDHANFDDIPLAKANVRWPGRVFVGAQSWEAMQQRRPERLEGKEKVELTEVDPEQRYLVRSAPYFETYRFFDWYYEKYCQLATEVWREHHNPVPRTIMSAPGGFYPKVDVFNFAGQGAFYPKERSLARNAIARRDYGDHLGFSGAMWAYFDLRTLWSCVLHSSLLAGNAHIDYWVDIPLTFNGDLTHTRASFWTRLLRRKLAPIEPILLHRRFSYTPGLAMYVPEQPLRKGVAQSHFGAAVGPNAPVYSALEKSGYLPRVLNAGQLTDDDADVLVASHAQVVSPEDGRAIREFVREGGLLIATPWLAACTPHGNMLTTYPSEASGLADLLGFRLLNTSQRQDERTATVSIDALPTSELTLRSEGRDRVLDMQDDVRVLARYDDGEPLLLERRVGEGRVVYLNMVYDWSHWWNSFYEPGREAYRRLIEALLRDDGRVAPRFGIRFASLEETDLNEGWWGMKMSDEPRVGDAVPWWASQTFESPDGRVRYLAVFADHRSPIITADVNWHDAEAQAFDLFGGEPIEPREPGVYRLTLKPGEAALWAFASAPPRELRLAAPEQVRGEQTVAVDVTLVGVDDDEAAHGVVLDVLGPDGVRRESHSIRNGQITGSSGTLHVPFAANDPGGTYRLVATDSLARRRAEAEIEFTPVDDVPDVAALRPFPPRAADRRVVREMASEALLDHLRRLRAIYLETHEGMEAKYRLSYFLNSPGRDDTRHAIMRTLQRTPWQPHLDALAEALRDGERFVLLGEDMNIDPQTGARIDPFAVADPPAILDALAALPDAQRSRREVDGVTIERIALGEGVLIVAETSVDRQAYTSEQFRAWHERVRPMLERELDGQ